MNNTPFAFAGASWVWAARQENRAHQYVLIRKVFTTTRVMESGVLHISADSDFVAYLDGEELGRGQFSDYPEEKTYSSVEVGRMEPGRHVLAIHGYYRGENFSEHRAGRPGVIASLCDSSGTPVVQTDGTFKAIPDPGFTHGPLPKVTVQMGFTTIHDARKAVDFALPGFDDSAWAGASVESATATGGYWKSLTPRPVKMLSFGDAETATSKITLQGDVIRPAQLDGAEVTVAHRMAGSGLIVRRFWEKGLYGNESLTPTGHYVSPPPGPSDLLGKDKVQEQLELLAPAEGSGITGRFIIFDVGQQSTGLLSFRITAPAGTRLDIAHGEHLHDGRVRVVISGRQFADCYICKEGLNEFTLPFRRIGGRYIEVHFSDYSSPIRIHNVGLRGTYLRVKQECEFSVPGPLMERMLELSVQTLGLCMHEHYEDCPWREQALYAYDSRNQALYGYYAFPNYDFAKASFDLLGRGIREDGLLELCAPAKIPITIPVFSMVWIVECQEHWLYSGDATLFTRFGAQMMLMVDKWLSAQDSGTGLYMIPEGKEIWNYYEWSTGLAGTFGEVKATTRLHAPYNLHLHETLDALAWMLEQAGKGAKAVHYRHVRVKLGEAIAKGFWNKDTGLYATYLLEGKPTHTAQLTNALMLHQGLVAAERICKVVDSLVPNEGGDFRPQQGVVPITLSAMFYIFDGVRRHAPTEANRLEWRLGVFADMITQGATSLWETAYGQADFHDAGSLCHAWSSLPLYYAGAIKAGIVPVEAGFAKTLLAPTLRNGQSVRVLMATPRGKITGGFERTGNEIHGKLSVPKGIEVEFKPVGAEAGKLEITYV